MHFQFQALATGHIENVCFLRKKLADSRSALPPLQVIAAYRMDLYRAANTYLVLQFSIRLDNSREEVPAAFDLDLLDDVDAVGGTLTG